MSSTHSRTHRSILPSPATLLLSSFVLLFSSLISPTHARITCQSPVGSHTVGDILPLQWSDNGAWPKSADVYSADADVVCSTGSKTILTIPSITNGQSWTIPPEVLSAGCPGNRIRVEYGGKVWDVLHLLHVLSFSTKCEDMVIAEAVTTTTTTTTIITTTTPATTTTLLTSTIGTTTMTTATTNGSLTITSLTTAMPTTTTGSPTPDRNGGGSSTTITTTSRPNTAAIVFGILGGIVLIGLVVFGIIVSKRRKRRMEEQKWLTQEALNRAGFGGGSAGAVGSSVATSAGRRAGGRPSYEDQLGFYRQDPVPVGKAPLPSQEFIPLTQAPAQHSHLGNVPMMQEYNHRHQHQLPPPATLSGRSPHEEQSYWPPTSGSEYEVPPPHGFHTYASGPYNNHHHHHHQQQQQQQQQQYDQFHPAQDLRAPASIASPAPALAPMVTVGSESPAQGLMAVASPQPTNRDYYQRMQSLELPRLPLPPTITAPGTQQ